MRCGVSGVDMIHDGWVESTVCMVMEFVTLSICQIVNDCMPVCM